MATTKGPNKSPSAKYRFYNIFSRLKGRYRASRERTLRVVCRSLVSLSTFQARQYLKRTGVLDILVDSSVLSHSVTHETVWVSTGTAKWGPNDIQTGYAARIPVHSRENNSRTYREVRFLPGIAVLAKMKRLKLFTSAELQVERFRQPPGRFTGYGCYDLNLFSGIQMDSVDGFGPIGLSDPKGEQLHRVERCNDPLYRALLAKLGPQNSLDAFHIFTAEKHGLFCFLHMDFKLANLVKQHRDKPPFAQLKTLILTPFELGGMLGLLPVHTNILTYDGSSFPARPDLHRHPQQRKRPVRKSEARTG